MEMFGLMVALGLETMSVHIKLDLVTRSKGQRGAVSIMAVLVMLLGCFKIFRDLCFFMSQGLLE